jgi:class 3 adenylate cyclase
VCSVLFCDLVGFTSLAESRDPEAVRELQSRYFAVARAVIERYGGLVEKFIGDAVMAVWGTPVAAEGDAERAVRAGLEVVASVAELGEELGTGGLAARAGVVTGEVAVTLGAVAEGMVAGDTVNTAARVQSAAEAGQVLTDARTRRLADGGVGFDDAGSHPLKGKAAPVRLWRATRVLAGVGGVQRVDGLEAPLIGRDAELRTIKELFHAAAERRVPRLVLVSGPAGVGKSRLGWEFEKYSDGLAAQVWWHRGRCPSYGDGVAFWALAEIVRQRLSITEDELPELGAAKLAAGLAELIADEADRRYVGLRLGRLLGLNFADDLQVTLSREELFAGWRLFFARLASIRPVVMLVEDAQYADEGLLDFLEHLVDWVRDLPIYLLVFARPELGQARPGFGVGRNRSTLTLDPLDFASMDSLVGALVPGIPQQAKEAVTRHAQGLPLFAVETIRSLVDRDVVQPREGVYRLVGEIGELQVPESLYALLAARLDALEPGLRRLLADAAVLGNKFPAEALAAISGQGEPAVAAGLAELQRREVLSVSADPLSPERGSYRFTQDMLRQVAYRTMSRRDRKARHLKVAAYLSSAFPGDGEEVADIIARHYLDALEAVPSDSDVGQIRGQAISALTRAAERAERTGAPALAATSYAAAARLTQDHDPGRLQTAGALWERAANSAITNADWADSVAHANRARACHLQRGDSRAAARAQAIAGTALRRWDRLAEAREQLGAALDVLRVDPDADTVRALRQLAVLEGVVCSPQADALSSEALALGQAIGIDSAELSGLMSTRAGALHFTHPLEAVAYYRESARLAEQIGDTPRLGSTLFNMAEALEATDPAAAADAASAAAGHLRRVGDRHYLAYAIISHASALRMLGDWDAAEQELASGLDRDGLADVEYLRCDRGLMAGLRGDTETADAMLASLPDMRASENPQNLALVSLADAFAAAAHDQPEAALRHARIVLSHAAELGLSYPATRWAWPLAASTAHALGDDAAVGELLALLDAFEADKVSPMLAADRDLVRARRAAGHDDPAAAAQFGAAISSLRDRSTSYHLAHGLLDFAVYLIGSGDMQAAAAIGEARQIAERLRCQPLLDRVASTQLSAADTLA